MAEGKRGLGHQFCPHCGERRLGNFRFCRSCGFDFDHADEAAGSEPTIPMPARPEPVAQMATPQPEPTFIATPANSAWTSRSLGTKAARWWRGLSRRGKTFVTAATIFLFLGVVGSVGGSRNQAPVGAVAAATPSAPQPEPTPASTPALSSTSHVATATPPNPSPTPEPPVRPTPKPDEALRAIVATAFAGDTNGEKKRLRDVQIVAQQGDGWGVFVQFNADENLTNGLTKGGIELRMRDGYKAIYGSGLPVRAASMAAWLDVVDQYGNKSEATVYKTILEGAVARKVNWSNTDILDWPAIWRTSILYPFLSR